MYSRIIRAAAENSTSPQLYVHKTFGLIEGPWSGLRLSQRQFAN